MTTTSGQAYRDECLANGVPIPLNIGDPAWISRGQIPQPELFIAVGLKAEVLTYQSTSPPGMCVALPRFDNADNVQLDGVICLGQTNSKACFWDNQKNGTAFTFQRGTSRPFSDRGGGIEITRNAIGGTCTDCHAGENPYIIHDNVLGSLRGNLGSLLSLGLPTFASSWHYPIVGTVLPPSDNSVNYDFQSAGEFVYLRDADGLEIQTRQTPIATASNPEPNPHTGLASCVSVNTAVAARVGKHRSAISRPLQMFQRNVLLIYA